jgi:hypothetical protein
MRATRGLFLAGVVAGALAGCLGDPAPHGDESWLAASCAGLPAFAPGSYAGGARVQNVGRAFECKPFPYSGWCGLGGPYEPGVGWASGDAWLDLGACDGGGPDAGLPVDARLADARLADAGIDAGIDAGPTGTVCDGRAPVVAPGAPQADNVVLREVLRHDLALVSGTASASATSVVVDVEGQARTWPVIAGRWKALVPLTAGCNDISFRTGTATAEHALVHQAQTNPRRVRLVYLITADSDGRYDAPAGEPNDLASAVDRVRLAGRMLQTFTAEKMRDHGFGRRTFRLDSDASGQPVVQVFRTTLTTAQAHAMDGGALWSRFYDELGLGLADDVKVLGIMGMSHYVPGIGAVAHAALGGGNLAIFGSTGLHTWARTIDQVVARWTDARFIDTSQLHDDSAGRGTYWANYATGLGASMHEIGHTLSLPHPVDPSTVMGRGFDHVNRTFMMEEVASNWGSGIRPITAGDERGWDRDHAVRLRYHRFLSLDDVVYDVNTPPAIWGDGTVVHIASAAGIRHVQYQVDGMSQGHEEFLAAPPATFDVTYASLRQRFPIASTVHVSTIDDDGNIATLDVGL